MRYWNTGGKKRELPRKKTKERKKIVMFLRSDFYYEGPTATREHLKKLALNSRIFHHERKLSIRSHLKGCGSMVWEKNKKKNIRKVISLGSEDKRVLWRNMMKTLFYSRWNQTRWSERTNRLERWCCWKDDLVISKFTCFNVWVKKNCFHPLSFVIGKIV